MNSSSARSSELPTAEVRPTGRHLWTGLAIGAGVGVLSSLISTLGARSWYEALVKPEWAPPSPLLAPLQLLVFLLAGAGWAFLSASGAPFERKRIVLRWFWAQLALGLLWALCFFGAHSSGWGYTVILTWWCAVVALLWTGSRLSRTAFFLLLPLFGWVTFASALNFGILSFNVLRQTSAEMDADPRNGNSPAEPPIIVKKK